MEQDPSDQNELRVLLASDIHLGYLEKDAERGNDTFNTFEEILKYARDLKVRSRLAHSSYHGSHKHTNAHLQVVSNDVFTFAWAA
jgi:hypothetical protein